MTGVTMPWLWLAGPSGVGKTTVGWELFTRLAADGYRVGYVELDQLGMCLPAPPGEPGNDTIKATNLMAVLRGHHAAGADCMVVSGDITEDAMYRMLHASGLRSPVRCYLRAEPASLRARLQERGASAALVDAALAQNSPVDVETSPVLIDTTGLTARQVSDEAKRQLGRWPPPLRTRTRSACPRAAPEPVTTPPKEALLVYDPTAWKVFMRSLAAGIPTAYLDLAQLGFLRPTVDGDPHNHHLTASTAAALWPTFAKAGARRLILSCNPARGDADSATHLYRRAFPNVRLVACP